MLAYMKKRWRLNRMIYIYDKNNYEFVLKFKFGNYEIY